MILPALAIALATLAAAAAPWGDVAGSDLWDQGVAEVALYSVTGPMEGSERTYEAVMVVVKEPFDLAQMVKAGSASQRVEDVLKLNHEVTVPTGLYTYRQMASVFLRRSDLAPVKLTVASQELCGITTKRWRSDTPAVFHSSSYFDGEGDRDFALPVTRGTLFYDALPLWLRAQAPRAEPLRVKLVPGQISNHARDPAPVGAVLTWGATGSVTTPAGEFRTREVSVEHPGGRDRYAFAEEFPHVLVRWVRGDGTRYELRNLVRLPYWQYTRSGDRQVLEEPAARPAGAKP
jgi:hypothetical protein